MTKSGSAVSVTLTKRTELVSVHKFEALSNSSEKKILEKKSKKFMLEKQVLPQKKTIHEKINVFPNDKQQKLVWNNEFGDKLFNFTFVCQLCGHSCEKQFSFYLHLKHHYEDTDENVNSPVEASDKYSQLAHLNNTEINKLGEVKFESKDEISDCYEKRIDEEFSKNGFTLVNIIEEPEIIPETSTSEAKPDYDEIKNESVEHKASKAKKGRKVKRKLAKSYSCDICGKIFLTSSGRKVHLRIHYNERPYSCPECGVKFRQLGDLRYHQQSKHSKINDFQCEFCGKEFARKYSLTLHRKIHTGELNHQCDYCSKAFRAAVYLQNHRRIHTGEKPFLCPKCPKKFRVKADVSRHLRVHEHRSLSELEPPTVVSHLGSELVDSVMPPGDLLDGRESAVQSVDLLEGRLNDVEIVIS